MNAILRNTIIVLVLLLLLVVIPPIINFFAAILGFLVNPLSTLFGGIGKVTKSETISNLAKSIKDNKNIAATVTGSILVIMSLIFPFANIIRIGLGLLGLVLVRDGASNLAAGVSVNEKSQTPTPVNSITANGLKQGLAVKEVVRVLPLASYFEN